MPEDDQEVKESLSKESSKFCEFFLELNRGTACRECPSNNVLNALTYRFTLYYLQDVVTEVFHSLVKGTRVTKMCELTEKGDSSADTIPAVDALVNTVFIQRVSKQRTKWVCAVCYEPCKQGDIWYVLCNCQHRFHVECLGKWMYKGSTAGKTCPLCRGSVGEHASDIAIVGNRML